MAVGDAHVSWLFHTSTDTNLFPKPPTTFLRSFCRGERRKYTIKKFRLNRLSNSQPPGHESDTLTTESPGRCNLAFGKDRKNRKQCGKRRKRHEWLEMISASTNAAYQWKHFCDKCQTHNGHSHHNKTVPCLSPFYKYSPLYAITFSFQCSHTLIHPSSFY